VKRILNCDRQIVDGQMEKPDRQDAALPALSRRRRIEPGDGNLI